MVRVVYTTLHQQHHVRRSNGWALCPAWFPKIPSRTTRYTHRRPSPSPTVNVYSTPTCQGRARLDGSSRRQPPTPTRTHKHARTHTHAHPHPRAQARARDRARTRTRSSTQTQTHARTRKRTQTRHAHARAQAQAPAPAPAQVPGTTHLDKLIDSMCLLERATKPLVQENAHCARPFRSAAGRSKASRPKRRAHQNGVTTSAAPQELEPAAATLGTLVAAFLAFGWEAAPLS